MSDANLKDGFGGIYNGQPVLVTGHTGFKGSWLCEWLLAAGADVTGFSLPAPTNPSLFDQLNLSDRLRHVIGDIRDMAAVKRVIAETRPAFVFHLAAQPLVRLSYDQPVETFATNVMGTVHVMEALRQLEHPCAAVMVTTDKCYENREWVHSYREEDPMGGYDPYSSSKGAAEITIAAYRRSYFSHPDAYVRLASARAGNVVGGGDWAPDRLVPDSVRALERGCSIAIRNKTATRPWQHVLEPLSGYMLLASKLRNFAQQDRSERGARNRFRPSVSELCSAFNFGPPLSSNRTVAEVVDEILKHWPGTRSDHTRENERHEATLLNLSTDKAYHLLGWSSVWGFQQTIAETIDWYRAVMENDAAPLDITQDQLRRYAASFEAKFASAAGR